MHDAYGLGRPRLRHLWDLTFGDYRGLFFYMPLLPAAIAALFILHEGRYWWRDPIVLPALLSIAAIAGFGGWWGGWTYGPRYLSGAAILLAYRTFPSFARASWSRWAFPALTLFGLGCAFTAKDTVWFSLPTEQFHPVTDVVLPVFGHFNTLMQWPVVAGIPPGLSSILFLIAFAWGLFALGLIDRASSRSVH